MTSTATAAASTVTDIPAALPAATTFDGHLDTLAETLRRTRLTCVSAVTHAAALVMATLRRNGVVLTCGNGGSAAQAQHLAAELVGRMTADRPALRATSLTADAAIVTALGNDYGYERVFARQVEALGRPGDALVAFSVSGRSANVLAAIETARAQGLHTILVTGPSPAPTAADVVIAVPSHMTSHVQEMHLAVIHSVALAVERELFADLRAM